MTNHYTDASDSPGWLTTFAGGVTSTTVYGELVGSDLGLSLITDDAGSRGELALTTPRGDIAATVTLTTSGTAASGLDSYTRYTEYGQPVTPQPTATAGTAANGYGWLGNKQRSTTTIGILLMGARLYNPTTGHFTSIDPVQGGNHTPYAHPVDPINWMDATGRAAVLAIPAVLLAAVGAALVTYGLWVLGPVIFRAVRQELVFRGVRAVASIATLSVMVSRAAAIPRRIAKPSGSKTGSSWRVYRVSYSRKQGGNMTWKYGITSQLGDTRPKDGVRECKRQHAGCTFTWLRAGLSYYGARQIEYAGIAAYYLLYGSCPPGQDKWICK